MCQLVEVPLLRSELFEKKADKNGFLPVLHQDYILFVTLTDESKAFVIPPAVQHINKAEVFNRNSMKMFLKVEATLAIVGVKKL